jgi:PPM family protein phosphatase
MNNPQPEFVACFQFVPRTDIGMRRANNQDSYTVIPAEDESSWRERGHLLIVADGMGAHAAGELASKIATDKIAHYYYHNRDLSAAEALRLAIVDTNAEIHRRGLANPDFRGMGTTASALVLLPDAALVGHVGDSRVYRLRDRRLEQLTFDHSLQWELRRNTKISEDSDFVRSIPKNVITRSLGPNSSVTPDIEGPYPLQLGDIFLLCSDGLTGQIPDAELAELLICLPPNEAAQMLIDLANLRGGPDNITLIIARVVDDRALAKEPPTKVVRRKSQPGSPLSWVVAGPVAGVCLLFAVLLAITEQTLLALVLGGFGIAVLLAEAVFWLRQRAVRGDSEGTGSRFGEGPYVTHVCGQNGDLAGTLSETLAELREAARAKDWNIRWQDIDGLTSSAEQNAEAGRFPEAIRHYADAIRQLMEELRRQPPERRADSSVEL